MSAAEQLAPQLTAEAAEALVSGIVAGLEQLERDVAAAYHGGAAAALGYGSGAKGWAALCRARFGHLEWFHIKPGPRRLDLVATLRRQQMPTRAIGDAVGISAASVVTDLDKCRQRGDVLPDNVVGLDGKRRSATAAPKVARETSPAAPLVPAALRLTELMRTALELVAGCGSDGATLYDVADRLRWREGRTSSVLHRLERAGLVRRMPGKRGTIRPYVATLPA